MIMQSQKSIPMLGSQKSTIRVLLMGGLGNQMFEFAAAYTAGLRLNKTILLDTSFYKRTPPTGVNRPFELTRFTLPSNVKINDVGNLKCWLIMQTLKYLPTQLCNLMGILKQEDAFETPNLNFTPHLYLGYFQHQKYFLEAREKIKEVFASIHLISETTKFVINEIEKSDNSVCLHVRRGDYVSNEQCNKFHGTAPLNYYLNAINKLEESCPTSQLNYFIFSDDIDWCRKQFDFLHKKTFVAPEGMDSAETINAMSKCKHFIIANSTFSWWAAWLGRSNDSTIIMPAQWTAKLLTKDTGLVIDSALVL